MTLSILVVSDTCSRDPSQDKVAATIKRVLPEFEDPEVEFTPDSYDSIQAAVVRLASRSKLLIASGGTGFSPNDVTPEAIQSVIDKDAPGITAAMLLASLRITPMAALSRPTAGILGSCLVISIPGSPKAVAECLEPLKPVLSHGINLISGESSRQLHQVTSELDQFDSDEQITPLSPMKAEEKSRHHAQHFGEHESGHSHDHSLHDHTHHHEPAHNHSRSHSGPRFYGPANRPRESPYKMIPFEDARKIVFEHTPEPHSIMVRLEDSLGHVLAEDLHSPINVPPFRASIVDGYAVTHSDCPGTLPVSRVLVASSDLAIFTRSTCVRITTGAPVPHGATAVVPVENTVVAEEEDGEELKITITASNVRSGDNIRKIGSDLALGSVVLHKGTSITAVGGEVGTLASTGLFCVPVYAKPKVGVLSTGNELVNVDENCYGSQIWDSNRPMLLTTLRYRHIPAVDLGIARDDREKLMDVLNDALEKVDILVTTGGVSMGELDLLKPTIEAMGGQIHFGRVAMKPGKPMTFATLGKKCIFALPGNPASAAVCLNLFVLPCIDKWSGADPEATVVQAKVDARVALDPRPEFHRVHLKATNSGWVASSTGSQRSSRVKSLAGANAVLCLPPSSIGVDHLDGGSLVDAVLLTPP